ncbi:MAG: methyltransferase domain-containing protein [Anaerolineales bacterium]|nr:methyltransferase domain-containing protein [Anaerolineales bacterium]
MMNDPWNLGDVYDQFMGRWSRPVAQAFLNWLDCPVNGRWLDAGCGTGALCEMIVQLTKPKSVTGIDFSEGFIRHAQGVHPDPVYHFRAGSASALPVPNNEFDQVVSGLALNFFPQLETAVSEMCRVVKPGGTVAAYVWDYAGDMQMLRIFWDAAIFLDSEASSLDEGNRFPICQPEPLRALFTNAGLQTVSVKPLDTTAVFKNFDDYWRPFLGENGPAPGYVAGRTPEQKTRLAELLGQRLPIQPDGTIPLKMRAWAARGVKA